MNNETKNRDFALPANRDWVHNQILPLSADSLALIHLPFCLEVTIYENLSRDWGSKSVFKAG